jgi:divinyl chlorophyllide a 8-vinyl-reductase
MAFIPLYGTSFFSGEVSVTHQGPAHSGLLRNGALRSSSTPLPRRSAIVNMCAPGTGIYAPGAAPSDVRVVVFGATGYIGRFVVREFANQGFDVTAFARERSGVKGRQGPNDVRKLFGENVRVVFGDVTNAESVSKAFPEKNGKPVVIVSCLASRTGGIADSNKIDFDATLNTLKVGRSKGASHFILLSAICVQKPLLEFQRAKLRFEAELSAEAGNDSSFSYSIVRPTAFFKSLAAQVERMQKGSAYIMFGDGALSKCNALSESDLARFMVLCARDETKRNSILPVGGPGDAVTPREQAELVFRELGREPKYMSVPIGLMDLVIGGLDALGKVLPPLRDAAEFGRIGKYYATEDMVGPQFGRDTLEEFFANAVKEGGLEGQDLGDANIF